MTLSFGAWCWLAARRSPVLVTETATPATVIGVRRRPGRNKVQDVRVELSLGRLRTYRPSAITVADEALAALAAADVERMAARHDEHSFGTMAGTAAPGVGSTESRLTETEYLCGGTQHDG